MTKDQDWADYKADKAMVDAVEESLLSADDAARMMQETADNAARIGEHFQQVADRDSSAIKELIKIAAEKLQSHIFGRIIEDDDYGSGQYNESKASFLTNLISQDDAEEIRITANQIFNFYAKGWEGKPRWYHFKAMAMALHSEAIKQTRYAAEAKTGDRHFQNSLYAAILRLESQLCDLESERLYIDELEWTPPEQTFNPKHDEAITKSHSKVRGLLNIDDSERDDVFRANIKQDVKNRRKEAKVNSMSAAEAAKYTGEKGYEQDRREGFERDMFEWRNQLGDERNYRRAYVEMVRGKDLGEEPDPQTLAYMVDNASAKALGARIRRWRKRVGISPTALAAKLAVRVQAVSNWENGHAVPSDDNIKLMARLFGIRPRYLEYGIQEEEAERMAASEKKSSAFANDFVEVPLYTDIKVAAGDGVISFVGDEAATKPLAFRADFFKSRNIDRRKARCLRVGGDSMSPYLMDGDVVLIEHDDQIRVKDGHCYALRYGTELRIKRLKVRLDGGLDLISDNDRYPTESVKQEEMQFVTVLGEVKWRAG